jgi:hypothetical protein
MHNVAERRGFDQQNARELGSLKIRGVRRLCLCCFDLTIQFAKDKSTQVSLPLKLRSATRTGYVFLFTRGSLILGTGISAGDGLPWGRFRYGAKPCWFRARRGRRVSISLREKRPGSVVTPPFSRPIRRHGFFSSTPRTDGGFAPGALPPRW